MKTTHLGRGSESFRSAPISVTLATHFKERVCRNRGGRTGCKTRAGSNSCITQHFVKGFFCRGGWFGIDCEKKRGHDGPDHSPTMSDVPPPLSSAMPERTGLRMARWAAFFSLAAPALAILLGVLVFTYMRFQAGARTTTVGLLFLIPFFLVFAGVGFGVAALFVPKRHERKGIFGKAVVGVCINMLLLALGVIGPLVFGLVMGRNIPFTPQGRLASATNALAAASTEETRFYALDGAAKESFNAGNIEEARKDATELLTLAPKYQGNWNYGNAIQDGNVVLGRIAVKEGKMDEAQQHLLAAGNSPGSPQMNSFGPNMSLAKDLLEKGDTDTPLQYFDLCRKFWTMDYGKLNDWSNEVKAGKVPDFGANLVY
jgi:hypothetical protein